MADQRIPPGRRDRGEPRHTWVKEIAHVMTRDFCFRKLTPNTSATKWCLNRSACENSLQWCLTSIALEFAWCTCLPQGSVLGPLLILSQGLISCNYLIMTLLKKVGVVTRVTAQDGVATCCCVLTNLLNCKTYKIGGSM